MKTMDSGAFVACLGQATENDNVAWSHHAKSNVPAEGHRRDLVIDGRFVCGTIVLLSQLLHRLDDRLGLETNRLFWIAFTKCSDAFFLQSVYLCPFH